MKPTSAYFPEFFALLKQLDIDNDGRHELVYDFTDGRTNSSKELRPEEIQALIAKLRSMAPAVPQSYTARTGKEAANKMRRKVISLAHQMGWEYPSSQYGSLNGRMKPDMDRINAWCNKYGYLHKPLNDYTVQELPRLLTQFENMFNDFVKGMKK